MIEVRIARLESDVGHIRSDLGDVKQDVRDRVDSHGERFDKRVDELRLHVDKRFDEQRLYADKRFDELSNRVDAVERSLASAKAWALLLFIAQAAAVYGTLARTMGWI